MENVPDWNTNCRALVQAWRSLYLQERFLKLAGLCKISHKHTLFDSVYPISLPQQSHRYLMNKHIRTYPSLPQGKKDTTPPILVTTELTPDFPDIRDAVTWLQNTAGNAPLTRADVRPEKMVHLIRIMSLFDVLIDKNKKAQDLYVRVFSTAMTEIYGEMTGHLTSEKLSPDIQSRFLIHAQAMLDTAGPVFSRTRVAHHNKNYITAEGLTIPLWKDGRITQCLNFFSFR